MKVAVAGIPGGWSSERLSEALRGEGIDSFVFSLGDVVHDLVSGRVAWCADDLSSCDGIAVKKLGDQSNAWARLRLHALRALEAAGVRVFSPAAVIDVAMDRYCMTMTLGAAGLPVPATLAAESDEALRQAARTVGDCVVKPVYTSKGRGMVRVAPGDENALARVDAAAQRYLVQQFVRSPGRDIGATVIGGAFVGAFYRIAADGEWRTTTSQGGRYAPCDLSANGIEHAERAARAFGLDYTVVDLVEQGGDFLLYEVSAFGGFRGLQEASGIDAAALYAAYIARELRP